VEALEDRERLGEQHTDPSDDVHNIADSSVPIYTGELWRTFVDLSAWNQADEAAEEGLVAKTADMDTRARVALYVVAERLAGALLEEEEDNQ
jgi:hypothetical protein